MPQDSEAPSMGVCFQCVAVGILLPMGRLEKVCMVFPCSDIMEKCKRGKSAGGKSSRERVPCKYFMDAHQSDPASVSGVWAHGW